MLLLISLVLLAVVCFLAHKWATQNFNFFKDRNIVYGKPIAFLGTGKDLFFKKLSLTEFIDKWYHEFDGNK